MKFMVISLVASLVAIHAHAQDKVSLDPSDPRAPAAPLRYDSAFAAYRAARDEKPAAWKQVNEEVGGAQRATHGGSHESSPSTPMKERGSATAQPPAAKAEEASAHRH